MIYRGTPTELERSIAALLEEGVVQEVEIEIICTGVITWTKREHS